MMATCFLVIISTILAIINASCDCNYWRHAGDAVAHGVNECEYDSGISRQYECEYDDGQGQYRIKETLYNNTDCSGFGYHVVYKDETAEPSLHEYHCQSQNDCNVAAIEKYVNSGSSNTCTNSMELKSRETRVTDCCFDTKFGETVTGSSISQCESDQITQKQWISSSIAQCNAYDYEPYVIIGGFGSEGMSFKRFDPDDNTLTAISGPVGTTGTDPETFALNLNKNIIYTSGGGSVVAVTFDSDNSFALSNTVSYSISTNAPTYISTDANNIFVYSASYGWDQNGSSGFQVFKVNQNTGYFNPTTPIIDRGFTANPNNIPLGSHSHCILPNPKNPYHFYLADLGRNVVEHYEIIDNQNGTYSDQLRSNVSFDAYNHTGPRTLAFHPTVDGILYVSLELVYKVSVITFDTTTYALTGIQQIYSTLPDTSQWNGITAAVGHVDTDREGKYLYVANRDNSQSNVLANNIAIFQLNTNTGLIVDGSLFIDECGGNIPRQFKVDPSNNYMFIANQFGPGESGWPGTKGNVAIYQIDHNDGKLKDVDIYNYTRLGYNGIGVSWIDFINNTIYTAPSKMYEPASSNNACYDDSDQLTDTYTVVTCDYVVPTTTTTTKAATTTTGTDTETTTTGTDASTTTDSSATTTKSGDTDTTTATTKSDDTTTTQSDGTTTTNSDDTSPTTDGKNPAGNNAINVSPIISLCLMAIAMFFNIIA